MDSTLYIVPHIRKGEVVLLRGDFSVDERVRMMHGFVQHPDVVCISSSKFLVEDARRFSDDFRKSPVSGVSIEKDLVSKLGILITDDIGIPAQHMLLKELEDIDSDSAIILLVHTHTTLLPTLASRVMHIDIKNTETHSLTPNMHDIFPSASFFEKEKSIHARIERVKKVIDAYDEGVVTKQDIVTWVESLSTAHSKKHCAEVVVLLKQPSVLIKYVLEFFVGWL